MKTLILFDLDGTLLHSARNDSRSFAETYEELYGRPFPTIDWLKYPHVTDTTILESVVHDHFGRSCSWAEMEAFQVRYIDRMRLKREEDHRPYQEVPAARVVLERLLADDRFQVGIATGGWEAPARFKLEHLAFPLNGVTLVGADRRKTREHILEDAIQQSRGAGPAFQRIVYVGDALWDVRTTSRMGMNFIGIRVRGDLELLRQEGVQFVFQDYSDFPAFLEAVGQAGPPELPAGDLPAYRLF